MASRFDQPGHGEAVTRGTHRVAIELEVDEQAGEVDPGAWELHDLVAAVKEGLARPLRTIRGLVVDPENDRMSETLAELADDIEEVTRLQWRAIASRRSAPPRPARSPRPSLDLLLDLEELAAAARHVSQRLVQQGL